jgi:hypothetical protein
VKSLNSDEIGFIGRHRDPRAWFIESNVAVLTNTSKEELNATIIFDLLFVRIAFCDQVLRISIKNIDLGGWNVD